MSGRTALLEDEVEGSSKEGIYQVLSSKEEKEVEAEEGSDEDDSEEKAGCEGVFPVWNGVVSVADPGFGKGGFHMFRGEAR